MFKCKACGADMVFITTVGGKSMPCDAAPVMYWEKKGAKGKVVTKNGEVISCVFEGEIGDATGIGYLPHWATCPGSKQFRKGS